MRMYTNNEWSRLEEAVKDYLSHMSSDDLDYDMMLQVYKTIQQRQSYRQMVRDYNETYFREVIQFLEETACLN